jgi:hypothetical protein
MPAIDRMRDLGFEETWAKGRPAVIGWYTRYAEPDAFKETYYKGARLIDNAGATAWSERLCGGAIRTTLTRSYSPCNRLPSS